MGTYADAGQQADDRISGLEAALTQLQADFDAYRAAHPDQPQPARHWRGTSLGVSVPGGRAPYHCVRVYLQPGERPLTWDADNAVRHAFSQVDAGGVLWVSAKEAPAQWLPAFLDSCAAQASRQRLGGVVYTQNHEFGNDGPGGAFPSSAQVSDYHQRWQAALRAAAQAGVMTADIQLGSQTPAQWDQLHVDGTTFCGFDRYNPGIQKPKRYVHPSDVFAQVIAYAKGVGKPLAIGETGTGVVGSDTAGRVQWAAVTRALLADPASGCELVAWWNQGGCAMDEATAAAWLDTPTT